MTDEQKSSLEEPTPNPILSRFLILSVPKIEDSTAESEHITTLLIGDRPDQMTIVGVTPLSIHRTSLQQTSGGLEDLQIKSIPEDRDC